MNSVKKGISEISRTGVKGIEVDEFSETLGERGEVRMGLDSPLDLVWDLYLKDPNL